MKSPTKVLQGKKNRQKGSAWELFVRKDLEKRGWIVLKNSNNVIDGKFVTSKPKYNPFTKSLMMNSGGFPDFIIFRPSSWSVQGVEAKSNGYLDKIEKEKCKLLVDNKILKKIIIAKKSKEKGKIIYKNFLR